VFREQQLRDTNEVAVPAQKVARGRSVLFGGLLFWCISSTKFERHDEFEQFLYIFSRKQVITAKHPARSPLPPLPLV